MTAAETHAPTRARFKWLPIAVVAAVVAAVLYFWLWSGLPRGWIFLINLAIGLLGTALVLAWVGFFSGLALSWRLVIVCAPLALPAVFLGLFRVKCDGDTIPRSVSLRFVPKAHESLPQAPAEPPAARPPVTARPEDYPQFQGANRDGHIRGVKLARDWKKNPPRELWRINIGAGWSGFSVVGGCAFTQEQRGPQELVSCYDWKTGALLWAHADEQSFVSEMGGDGPRATPTVHEGRVYSVGAKGLVNCLDAASGKHHWSYDIVRAQEATVTTWGHACSPLVVGDLVLVTGGGGKGASLLALDRLTGEARWTAAWDEKGGTIADSYASPTLSEIGGIRQIMNLEDKGLASYDLTGKQLWKISWPWGLGHPKVSQPIFLPSAEFAGGHVLIASGYTSGSALYKVEKDAGGGFRTAEIWKNNNLKPKFCNVVVRGDYAYGLDARILACINWRTGERQWKDGRYGHGQILLVDDLILVQSEDGPVALVEASPSGYVELGQFNALSDRTWNTMALAGPYLLVRNDHEAACFELPLADVASPPAGQ